MERAGGWGSEARKRGGLRVEGGQGEGGKSGGGGGRLLPLLATLSDRGGELGGANPAPAEGAASGRGKHHRARTRDALTRAREARSGRGEEGLRVGGGGKEKGRAEGGRRAGRGRSVEWRRGGKQEGEWGIHTRGFTRSTRMGGDGSPIEPLPPPTPCSSPTPPSLHSFPHSQGRVSHSRDTESCEEGQGQGRREWTRGGA